MNPDPVFSVIIPTYNRALYIKNALQSIIDQDYGHFEVIVVDDGSTDNTEDVVNSVSDNRIRYVKKGHEERAIARNHGIQLARGQYMTFLDSDDLLYPHCFSEALRIIEDFNNPEWFHLAYEIKDTSGKVIRRENRRKGDLNKVLITGNYLSCVGIFVRFDLIQNYPFNEDPDIIGSEDYILWMELASRYLLRYSNKISACILQHPKRSVENFKSEKLIRRVEKSIGYITNDTGFNNFFGKNINKFVAHRYLYLTLHLLLNGSKKQSFTYFIKAIKWDFTALFSRKTISLAKKYLIH